MTHPQAPLLVRLDHCRQLLTWARQAVARGRIDEAALHLASLRRDLPRISSTAKSCVSGRQRASIPTDTHKRPAAGRQPCRLPSPEWSGPRLEKPTSER